MRKLLIYILSFVILTSCEDVVDVDLPEVETKLVVDGLLRVDKNQEFINVEIGLRESSNYFEENQPVVAESVVISYGQLNNDGTFNNLSSSTLVESETGTGIYVPDPNAESDQRIPSSAAEPETIFILEITYQNKYFLAQTVYAPTVPLDNLQQGDDTLFDDEETEIVVTFTDNADKDDFYVFDFMNSEFQTVEDEYFQGQQFEFSYFYNEKLEIGQEVTVSILGATEDFYDYMDLVLEQTQNNGGVFQSPVATVRGNVFVTEPNNEELPNDYALGYFAVVQEYSKTIIIE